uniref:Uncharacterized protein n=1 Tax=Ananas comosus var. bracteatus TaxID=296719 RepID=A0A6V7PHI2_ANACO|nr:unnamed protein product [Ananas comosus var. bracteatus]
MVAPPRAMCFGVVITGPSGKVGVVGCRTHWKLCCSSHTPFSTEQGQSEPADDRGKGHRALDRDLPRATPTILLLLAAGAAPTLQEHLPRPRCRRGGRGSDAAHERIPTPKQPVEKPTASMELSVFMSGQRRS